MRTCVAAELARDWPHDGVEPGRGQGRLLRVAWLCLRDKDEGAIYGGICLL